MRATTITSRGDESAEQPSQTIVTMIADLEGTSPTELSPPLFSAVDPEALDSLFRSSATDDSITPGHVCFEYHGYEVQVESTGEIAISKI